MVFKFWFNQRNQGSVSYDFSCTIKLSSRVNQIQKGNSCMKHVDKKENQLSNFVLLEETMDVSRIQLAVRRFQSFGNFSSKQRSLSGDFIKGLASLCRTKFAAWEVTFSPSNYIQAVSYVN